MRWSIQTGKKLSSNYLPFNLFQMLVVPEVFTEKRPCSSCVLTRNVAIALGTGIALPLLSTPYLCYYVVRSSFVVFWTVKANIHCIFIAKSVSQLPCAWKETSSNENSSQRTKTTVCKTSAIAFSNGKRLPSVVFLALNRGRRGGAGCMTWYYYTRLCVARNWTICALPPW